MTMTRTLSCWATLATLLLFVGCAGPAPAGPAVADGVAGNGANTGAAITAQPAAQPAAQTAAQTAAQIAAQVAAQVAADTAAHRGTKTPYRPQQAAASVQPPPPGAVLVHTQLVARHGSRGLSSPKSDLLAHDLWRQAEAAGALTPLGRQFGADVLALVRANALLGDRVDGITRPGYGNLTRTGIREHQQLAQRLQARSAALLADATRQVEFFSSGRDRAVDSAANFAQALLAAQPALNVQRNASGAPLVTVDRFRLYFHKLNAATDAEPAPGSPLRSTWLASQAYQAQDDDPLLRAKAAQAARDPTVRAAARTVLERLFTPAFVAQIDAGTVVATGAASFTFTSADGQFTNTVAMKDKERVAGIVDAAQKVYELYSIAAGMTGELGGTDFSAYMPPAQADVFEALDDSADFYEKGPGIAERGDRNFAMAQALFDDFFAQVDRIAAGDMRNSARLRFAHAEHVIPLLARLGIPGMSEQLPQTLDYSHANSPWRGARAAPMAANLQWDTWRLPSGALAVRQLHNERETPFKPACDGARLAPGSVFYDWTRLKACYGR